MTAWRRQQGEPVNEKRVRRLLRPRGLRAVYPTPHLSHPWAGGQRDPDVLTGVQSARSDHLWATDITDGPLGQGVVSLVAMRAWDRREVWSWEVSSTLDRSGCVSALERAVRRAQPAIFNAAQGAQFTSLALTERWREHRILISRDGRGRAFDHILVERLGRSVKDEAVSVKDDRSVQEAINGWRRSVELYNRARLPQALNDQTPETVYRQGQKLAAAAT
jgi:putative transposase